MSEEAAVTEIATSESQDSFLPSQTARLLSLLFFWSTNSACVQLQAHVKVRQHRDFGKTFVDSWTTSLRNIKVVLQLLIYLT